MICFHEVVFALRAHCGPDARAPSERGDLHKLDRYSIFLRLTRSTVFPIILLLVGAWLSLVERSVRDREVGGSNPLAPTKNFGR